MGSREERAERKGAGATFELAILLLEGPVIIGVDDRRDYGRREPYTSHRRRMGREELTLHCVYTHRGEVCRIISLRYANRKERDAYRATYPG